MRVAIHTILIIAGFSCNSIPGDYQAKPAYPINKYDTIVFDIDEFSKIPERYWGFYSGGAIADIVPQKKTLYWECLHKDIAEDTRGSKIASNGNPDYSFHASIANSEKGFFHECHPGICFSYIVSVKEDKSISVIDSEKKLKSFIGKIDNLGEALIIARINGYSFDIDSIIGGAYKRLENDYLLYLMEYSSWPTTLTSVEAAVISDGSFQVISKEIYHQTDDYIIE